MTANIELKTRHQFARLIEKRERWNSLRYSSAAQERFGQLVGIHWATQNCALDEISDPDLWKKEVLDEARARHLECHMAASHAMLRFSREKEYVSAEDLMEIDRIMLGGVSPSAGKYRQLEVQSLGEGHEPAEAELVPLLVENALDWSRSGGFNEMHEVEKAALMLIKLIDIQPFDKGNGRTLRLFSNFFLLKAGYPPAIIDPCKGSQYAMAIQNSLRFHTQPLIDLLAESVHQSLFYCLDEPPPAPGLTVLQ